MGNVMMNVTPKGGGSDPGDVDFAGIVVSHHFSVDEVRDKQIWHGFNGTGYLEGIWDSVGERIYL